MLGYSFMFPFIFRSLLNGEIGRLVININKKIQNKIFIKEKDSIDKIMNKVFPTCLKQSTLKIAD